MKKDFLSRINYFFTNQNRFFRIYCENPKYIFNLMFHLTISILSIIIIYNNEIKNYIKNFNNIESLLNINYMLSLKLIASVVDILLFGILFFILVKILKSNRQFKHVFSVICSSYYFISFQKILNLTYQIMEKENNNYDSSAINTIVDSIFQYFNIFSVFFFIFVVIGLYIVTEIKMSKLFFGSVLVQIINLIVLVSTSIIALRQNELITFKRALLNISLKQG